MWGKMTGPPAGSVLDKPLVIEPRFAGLFSRRRDALCCNEDTHTNIFCATFRRASKWPLFQSVATKEPE
jgi:hypothetical protein